MSNVMKMVKWRATFNYQSQQMTIEFDAPVYNENFNYKQIAKVSFAQLLKNPDSPIFLTNVEPVETYKTGL